jgi:hypothetical protein
MKLLIFLAVWKRPEITEICFMSINRIRKLGDVDAFAVISEPEMVPLCEKYGIAYTMYKNHPLGEKKNHGVREALKRPFDYMLEIGSDDLLKNEILSAYDYSMPVMGLLDFASINLANGACRRIKGDIMKFGAGRVISRAALESGNLWNDKRIKGLDGDSTFNLGLRGFFEKRIVTDKPFVLALKGEEAIHKYDTRIGYKWDLDLAMEGLGDDEKEAICSLLNRTSENLISA